MASCSITSLGTTVEFSLWAWRLYELPIKLYKNLTKAIECPEISWEPLTFSVVFQFHAQSNFSFLLWLWQEISLCQYIVYTICVYEWRLIRLLGFFQAHACTCFRLSKWNHFQSKFQHDFFWKQETQLMQGPLVHGIQIYMVSHDLGKLILVTPWYYSLQWWEGGMMKYTTTKY